jgi:excisionase family DNA binding protein
MSAEPLRVSEAARQLGISTRQLLDLINDRKINYVMVDGIAHIPVDALNDYQSKAS